MKKSILLSIFGGILCLTMLTGTTAPKKKPIFVEKLTKAEEIVEYFEEQEDLTDQDDDCDTCISIVGKAKLTLKPDMATIKVCIEKFNEDMNTSKNQNMTLLNDVMNALKEQGINENAITLDYFSAHPSYDYTISHQPVGFYSKSCFSFQVENLEEIPNYISTLTENGVTDICNICYSLSNIEEEYNNALAQALENAKTKAVQLLGSENLKICGIKEESVFTSNTLCRDYIENLSSSLMGEVEIEARVNVVFKM